MSFSRHSPVIRSLQLPGDASALAYEVCCSECGDDGGPAEEQTEEVRSLRGPYPSAERAREVLTLHRAIGERDW